MLSNLTVTPALLVWLECLDRFDPCPRRTSCCCRVPPRLSPGDDAPRSAQSGKPLRNDLCFRLTWRLTSSAMARYGILAVFVGVTGTFSYFFSRLVPVNDLELGVLQDSPSYLGLTALRGAFGAGRINPFTILIDARTPGAVLTEGYFQAEAALIEGLLRSGGAAVGVQSFTALSFFQGAPVPFSVAAQLLDGSSLLGNSSLGFAYRALAAAQMSPDQRASGITITTLNDPLSVVIVPWIADTRSALAALPAPFAGYLLGGYSGTMDYIRYISGFLPTYYSILALIVCCGMSIGFRSVGYVVRLGVTLGSSLALVFGLMALVYEPGPTQAAFSSVTPYLAKSKGVEWFIPVAVLSILVGLGCDYDLFLMGTVLELREKGWSDRAAVSVAVSKTSGVIGTAGSIMIISFAGLLGPKILVVNQFGFCLAVGVAVDTFIMRPVVVPALLSLAPVAPSTRFHVNWWPRAVPPVVLGANEEEEALLQGKDSPH